MCVSHSGLYYNMYLCHDISHSGLYYNMYVCHDLSHSGLYLNTDVMFMFRKDTHIPAEPSQAPIEEEDEQKR